MNKQLNQELIKQKIIKWEQDFPVNEWRIEGVDIWPYIRIKLYLFLLNCGQNESVFEKKSNDKIVRSGTRKGFIKYFYSIPKSIISLYFFFQKLKPKKLIFFGAHFHRTLQNGLYFNRFFDPMIAHHNLQGDIYFIEYEKVFPNSYNEKAIIPLHKALDAYKLLAKFRNKFLFRENKPRERLKAYQTFYNRLQNEFPKVESLKIDESSLNKWASKVDFTKGFFLKLYQKVNPKKLLFLSYYGYDDLAAAILAAHELKVKSIDFQHGPQTNVHMAYSFWQKHPDRPYNTMPLEYWNWDINSKKNIENWSNNTNSIKAKVVGHPYLAYCLKREEKKKINTDIFFSLQTLNLREMLPERILNLIKGTENKWVLRLHPRSNFTAEDLVNYLNENLIPKECYVIEDALSTPLPWSLARAKVHITNFSGCVIEAMMLGVPSIIIHKSGQEMFNSYLDKEKVVYFDAMDENFENEIKRFLDSKFSDNPDLPERKIIDPRL